jgi:uncharacterized protein with ATP-grasp and redox domains
MPPVDLPPPLMTSDPGSFARHTIVERKPRIIRRVIEDNDYSPSVVAALHAFREELSSQQPIRPLYERAPDTAFWNQELAAYQGKTWLEVPWYLAETYFYRRLLEAVRYFQPGAGGGRDPFEKQKQEQMEKAVDQLADVYAQFAGVEPRAAFETLLHFCLWGNRVDLSNFTVAAPTQGGLRPTEERCHILIDHTDQARELIAGELERVSFINDNVGMDLLFDLALADFMLRQGWARGVAFYLKGHPFFVSDAMPKDVLKTLSLLQTSSSSKMQELGIRMREYLSAGYLVLRDDPFWTSCLMFRQLPPPLKADLARSDLVILKGDVNYRRLLDDRHWPYTARMEEVAAYFPAPFLVLRTLKGEIMVGLSSGQAEALEAQDPTWLVNGKRGIVQLVVWDRRKRRESPLLESQNGVE